MAEVGSAFVTIMPSAKGFQKNLGSAISGPATAAGAKAGTQAGQGFGGSLKSAIMPIGGVFAGVFAVQKVGQFFSTAVSGASDMNETLSKSNTIFGDAAGEIEKWAEGAATGFGQSKRQALDAAAGFGNLFDQLGIGAGEAAGMSTQMVELASDFASFHNADITEVLSAQSAAFRGEYDAVQRFVPTINAAAVEQKALEMGLAASTKELDAQDKAIAVQTLLLEGAGEATGDFARTSDNLANKQRIANAQWEDAKNKLGQSLLPAMTAVTSFVSTTLIPAFTRIGPVFQTVVDVVGGVVTKITGWFSSTGAGSIGGSMSGLIAQIQPIWEQIKAVFQSAFDAIVAVVTWGVGIIQGFWDRFGVHILGFITETWDNIRTVFSGALSVIQGIFDVFAGIFTGDWSRVWDGIKSILSGVWDIIVGVVKQAINLVKTTIGAVMAGISQAWSAIWNTIKTVASNVWEAIKTAVSSAIESVRTSISNTIETIKTLWSAGWTVVKTAVSTAWENIKTAVTDGIADVLGYVSSLPGRIVSGLGNLGSLLYGAGLDIISGLWDGLKSMWERVTGWFSGLGGKIKGLVESALRIGSPSKVMIPLGENTMAGFLVGLEKRVGAVGDVFAAVGSPAVVRPAGVSVGTAGMTVNPQIRVFIGDRELTDIVSVEVDGKFSGGRHRANLGFA